MEIILDFVYRIYHKSKKINLKWSFITMAISILLSIPILTILLKLIDGPGESWPHITEFLLPSYLKNSAFLILTCTFLSLLLGVVPAWLVSRYNFPFRGIFEWILILPLAIPSYISAYAYAGIFDYSGPVDQVLGNITGKIDIMNKWGLSFVLSTSLFPYIYVSARSFFLNQSNTQIQAAQTLGLSESRIFKKVALPMARPAIVGGLLLVLMEVLSDYGASHYFGVKTFSTAIFRSWFSLEEPASSVYLSALLCLFVLFLISLERFQRKQRNYQSAAHSDYTPQRINLTNLQKYILVLVCSIPILLGFILPVAQLIYWTYLTGMSQWNSSFFSIIGQSFLLSSVTAFICITLSLLLIYGTQWSRFQKLKHLLKLATSGYTIPGVVIAVGIMIPTLIFDKWLITFLRDNFSISIGFLVNGSIIGLIFAYSVRFLAVSYQPIEANTQKIGKTMSEVVSSLGRSHRTEMFRITIPLLRKGLLAGGILVFVDVMKELPISLLLKPYDVMTLSIKAYEYASDELIIESALPSLIIVLTGLIPIILLNSLMKR